MYRAVKNIKTVSYGAQYVRNLSTKNLFQFQPKGSYDKDVGPMQAAVKKLMMSQYDWGVEHPPEVHAARLRRWINMYFTKLGDHPNYQKAVDNCDHDEMVVPARDGNDSTVRVLVHTPKNLNCSDSRIGLLYAHGGAVIAGSADLYKPVLSLLAQECGVVIYNVDYRLAPETKCPHNILDFYSSLKHISENAENLGIDKTRIAISGESGGGYICFGTMVMLAQRGESSLVKAALPIIPMVSDYFFSDSLAMTEEERLNVYGMRSAWKAIAQVRDYLFQDKTCQII